MAKADSAHNTNAPALSSSNAEKLYVTPLGYDTCRPKVELPPIDRRALMANAHRIAKRYRPHTTSYAAALAYGLKAAWQQVNVARSFASLRAQVTPRTCTAEELIASRDATRRCGSSYIGM